MIRVAYIVDHLKVGGAQRHLLHVARELDRNRYTPEIWVGPSDPGELVPEFERLGVPVRSFGIDRSLWSLASAASIRRVAREFHQRQIAIVHGYLFEGNVLAAATGRLGRVPVVLTSKRSLDRYARMDHRLAAFLSNRLSDAVVVNAEPIAELIRTHERCPEHKIVRIPNGVPLARIGDARDPDLLRIGMVGRLGWKKGYPHALEAFAQLRQRHPDLAVDIVGEGSERAALEELSARLGLDQTVRFLGRREDVPELLSGWAIYALSSVIEGMPNALLEAMAAGLAVVSTAAGGCGEVVVDGESGLLVPPGEPAAFAAALDRLLSDRGLRQRLGSHARQRALHEFSLDAMLAAMDQLYVKELTRAGLRVPASAADREAEPRGANPAFVA